MSPRFNPASIPNQKKKKFLLSLSEDEFRDQVVRPLFILKGLQHGKDLCGTTEDGKDCYFFFDDPVCGRQVYAVQTKSGDLKMSAKARDNVLNAATQLRTALGTVIKHASSRQKYRPSRILLVASGEINQRAQEYITDEVQDTRISFLDSDALIPDIDKTMPELWFGIDARTVPYLRNLRQYLISQSETLDVSQIGVGAQASSPISDEAYVQLYLHRYAAKVVRERGVTTRRPEIEQFPVQKVLERTEKLVLITGEAGAGKTTSLRRVALELLDHALASNAAAVIPVIFNAIEVVKSGIPSDARLLDTVTRMTAKLTPEAQACFDRDALVAGRVAVLIDGYDELASETERMKLLLCVRQFHEQFPECRVILTSRDYSFVNRVPEQAPFVVYRITPINFNQAEKLVRRLATGKSLPPEATKEVLRQLENVHGMDLNPLLVTIYVAATDYSRQDIPANITELFKKYTEIMLGRWDQGKGLAQQYHAPLKEFLLGKLAYQMHEERVVSWPLDRCLGVFRSELADRGHEADMSVLVDEMLNRSGLVRVEDDSVRFRHLLIQEFFAGRGLPGPHAVDALVGDNWWMKPLVFYFGQNPGQSEPLLALTRRADLTAGEKLYNSAVAVGWALQACYLTKKAEKVEVLTWVVNSLAATKTYYVEQGAGCQPSTPHMNFLCYYMYGRDAVAARVVSDLRDMLFSSGDGLEERDDLWHAKQFWCLVGLVESGQLSEVEVLLKEYRPSDLRFLVALHLCCYYSWKMRSASAAQTKIAKRLCDRLAPRISGVINSVLDEVKGILLELHQGQIRVIDHPFEPLALDSVPAIDPSTGDE